MQTAMISAGFELHVVDTVTALCQLLWRLARANEVTGRRYQKPTVGRAPGLIAEMSETEFVISGVSRRARRSGSH
jgi:hypothetical protein